MLSAEMEDNSEIFVCDMSLILDKVANLKAKRRRASMSTTYEIYRFAKPSKSDLEIVDYYSDYDSFQIVNADGNETGEYIRLFRIDDEAISNIVESRFARLIELPQMVTDYERLYAELGFDEGAIKNKLIHLVYSNGRHMDFSDGIHTKRISESDLKKYKVKIYISCVAIKMETLWNSGEEFIYPDRVRVLKYIPHINKYKFVPITNGMLSKAEIPFLIYERNKGKCFIEKY